MKVTKELAVEAILNLEETEFQKILDKLSDPDCPLENRKLFFYFYPSNSDCVKVACCSPNSFARKFISNFKTFRIHDLFGQFKEKSKELSPESTARIDKLIQSCGFRSYIHHCLVQYKSKNNVSNEDYKLIAEYCNKILGTDEDRQDYIDYLSNVSIFAQDTVSVGIKELLDSFATYEDDPKIKQYFYFSEEELGKFVSLYNSPKLDKYRSPKLDNWPYDSFGRNKLPEFALNSDLITYVNEGIPLNLSNEEHALFIYYTLCNTLYWDNKYSLMDNYGYTIDYLSHFNQHMNTIIQQVTSNSEVFCRTLCLITAQMINSYVDNVEACVLALKDSPHFMLWIRSDNMSAVFDPTIPTGDNTMSDLFGIESSAGGSSFIDLFNAKLGLPIFCKEIIYEKEPHYIYRTLDGIQHIIHSDSTPMSQYVNKLKKLIRENPKDENNTTPINLHQMLEAFVDIVKDPPMDVSTVRNLFMDLKQGGFFGNNLNFSILVSTTPNSPDINYIICIADPQSVHQYLALDLKELTIESLSSDEVKKRRENKTWLLEHPLHPIPKL